ncbi:hypothetical protein BCR34DRAFT_485907 [Clohesyomyces aquaticus]|uniref:RanBP2-type domain-containing protein n=1 Tax=Clohesyomyces aquaticus TaxID=1231657 RepID=A0A1Y1ZJA2_9PLEO|nr:hypothetical protein BCR34DRAFT_485907 [Clohesyomyces aquaticus]
MLPLTEGDFLDFIFNYFKAEYYPIRSFFSTAAADPRQPQRWVSMGHELAPLTFRAANAQAQKDLESLDYFVRQRNLDASFVRGIVIRFAKYEGHERLEKKLYESCRLDLMVRKALKEKHLIDTLWPSPAPKNLNKEFLQDGVKVRSWYGDMFAKYFKYLHSVDDFGLRPEVDTKIKSSGTLMLVPFVDHLVFGAVDPIMPIVAKGAGYSNAQAWKQKDNRGRSFGEPDRFEIRFDSPSDISETFMKTVVRQCRCMKCGANRDVTVAISVDPYPGPAAQRYSPGYEMPRTNDTAPPKAVSSAPVQEELQEPPTPAPTQQKQCPRCTFLNHAELKACEMCSADLPESTLVSKPASPLKPSNSKASHSHTGSLPPPTTKNSAQKDGQSLRPAPPNRHSLSSTLFSIFPFSQQQQTEHHAHLPKTQPSSSEVSSPPGPDPKPVPEAQNQGRPTSKGKHAKHSHSPKAAEPDRSPSSIQDTPHTPETNPTHPSAPLLDLTPPLSRDPEMAMMPLTPPATNSQRPFPAGLPQHLMDDFVPVSPSFRTQEEEEDAGWGEMSREEAKRGDSDDESEDEVDGRKEGLVDLDVVAFEERGVWGEDSD